MHTTQHRNISLALVLLASALAFQACNALEDTNSITFDPAQTTATTGTTNATGGTSTTGTGTTGTSTTSTTGTSDTSNTGTSTTGTGTTGTGTTGTTGCDDGQIECDDACITPDTIDNCGSCDPCPPLPNAIAKRCDEGMCNYICEQDFSDDNGDLGQPGSDGCEATCIPTADPTEICDGVDNNCDGEIDEGCDDDRDGFCDMNVPYEADEDTLLDVCLNGPGDCNDDPEAGGTDIHPDAPEICDGIDNNCEREVDEGCDDDGDGFCDDTIEYQPGEDIPLEVCPRGPGDCNDDPDNDGAVIFPNGEEFCDGLDNNCDGEIDEPIELAIDTAPLPATEDNVHRWWTRVSLSPLAPPENPTASLIWLRNTPVDSADPNTVIVPDENYLPIGPVSLATWRRGTTPFTINPIDLSGIDTEFRSIDTVALQSEGGITADFLGAPTDGISALWLNGTQFHASAIRNTSENPIGGPETNVFLNSPSLTRVSPQSTVALYSTITIINYSSIFQDDENYNTLLLSRRSQQSAGSYGFDGEPIEVYRTPNDSGIILTASRFSQTIGAPNLSGVAAWLEYTNASDGNDVSNIAWRTVRPAGATGTRQVWTNSNNNPINLSGGVSARRPYLQITPNTTLGDNGHILMFFENQTTLRIIWLSETGTIRGETSIPNLNPVPFKTLATAPTFIENPVGTPAFIPQGALAVFAEGDPGTDPDNLNPAFIKVLRIPAIPPNNATLPDTSILPQLSTIPVSPYTSLDIDSSPTHTAIAFTDTLEAIRLLLLDDQADPICTP